MNLRKLNFVVFAIEIFTLIIILFVFYKIYTINNDLQNSTSNRHEMMILADRLRQSSDDLTHFARTYVVTGNEKFKEQFNQTLQIRNGTYPRPKNYHGIYWDLDEEARQKNHPFTKKISLKTLMQKYPFTKEELELLKQSEDNSNKLVELEREAFNAMVGKFQDSKGNYAVLDKPNQALAIKLLHSEDYYTSKHQIMKPIDTFITVLDSRTKQENKELEALLNLYIIALFIIVVIFILENIFIYDYLNKKDQKYAASLEEKVKDQLELLREKDVQLLNQAKMASLGEMIGNIAHQWRQPLSVISTGSTGLKFAKKHGTVTDKFLVETCDVINQNAQYLSQTIEDFTNFIKGNRKQVVFNLSENIDSFLDLVKGTIKNHNISIIKQVDDQIAINSYPNELIQCFVNIFNNAKDALKTTEGEKYFFISAYIEKNRVIITFRDNAGGIGENILPHLFEPYFTTKHKSQGTGLGLSMTYSLIVDGMKGHIDASNVTYQYKEKEYKGAEFKIALLL